jgi:hypothetical protein
MKAYEATATIEAEPDAIRRILMDGESYMGWDCG